MDIELRIFGLGLFVKPASAGEPLRLLLPDSRGSDGAHGKHPDGSHAMAHWANLVLSRRSEDCTKGSPSWPSIVGAWPLDRTDVTFEFTGGEALDSSIAKVPRISELLPNARLKDRLDPLVNPLLAARFSFARGKFASCETDPERVRWKFTHSQHTMPLVAHEVRWSVHGVEDAVMVLRRPRVQDEVIHLKPSSHDTVYLAVGNLPARTAEAWPEIKAMTCDDLDKVFHDFKWLYRLFEQVGPQLPAPEAECLGRAMQDPTEVVAVTTSTCVPGLMP